MSKNISGPEVHINLNVRGMRPSATVAINERCNALRDAGREIYKLGLGQSPFPVPEQVVEELRAHAHEKDYLPVTGLRALRDAVADYHRRCDGALRSGDDVLIGPGSKELMFILQLVYYGDLLIPTPAWVSYAPQARIIGRNVRLLPTDATNSWQIAPQQLDALCAEDPGKPRLLILNYPSNPTGRTYTSEELQALASVARKHRLILLSDEIYGETHHSGDHTSISRWYPEGTIISSGLSKWCGAGGWRLGTFTFPRQLHWLLDAMASVASETYTSTSAPIQYAAVRAFEGGTEIERYLWHSRRILAALGQWIAQALNDAGIRTLEPQGGFYLFPDFSDLSIKLAERGIHDSAELCHQLLEDTGVAILPGSDFGRPPGELTARLAYVDFDGTRALEALRHLPEEQALNEHFLHQYCVNVTTAIRRLCDWVAWRGNHLRPNLRRHDSH
jgi:aspartate aminotransferase